MDIIDRGIEYYWVQLIIMKSIHEKIEDIDWQRVTEEVNEKGYAMMSQFLPEQSCEELIGKYDNSNLYRKTITMERHQFGLPKTCTYCKCMDEDVKYQKTISRYI
jgi:hypothetical protein